MSLSFEAAIEAAKASAGNDEAWDHVEALADRLERPDDVAQAYREALERDFDRERWGALARRAAAFFGEWYGDDPDTLHRLLARILERDPDAQWAFERLTDLLTTAARWDDLLGLFDRLLASTRDIERRKRLLDDAAHVAKDFAGRPARAIEYMLLELELDPSQHTLAAAIERLLEREQRWHDLIALWKQRLPQLDVTTARQTRLRIAVTYLDHLVAPTPALEELSSLLAEVPGQREACQQVERILAWDDATPVMRGAALDLLRTHYEAAHRPRDVVRALETAASFERGAARIPLLREAAARLAVLADDGAAMAHYAEVLRLAPTDADARRELRDLARRSDLQAAFARALVAAADAAEPAQEADLLYEAAQIERQTLGRADEAIHLLGRVLGRASAEPNLALAAAHGLNELLAAAGRDPERLEVLEQIAALEHATEVRRAVLGEVGRLADALGQTDRALRAYARRLEADPDDAFALDATIRVLDRNERWEPLVAALRRRADARRTASQRRADLVRIARLQSDMLGASDDAIETWMLVRSEYGDEPETTAALDRLLSDAGRFQELAEILAGASAAGRLGSASLLARLGEVIHRHLGRPEDATTHYAQALAISPQQVLARRGALALTRDPNCAREAANALAQAYRLGEEWDEVLSLVEVRIGSAGSPREAVEILREATALYEARDDLRPAHEAIGRAFVLDPSDPVLEEELLRLAAACEAWPETAERFAEAARATSSPARAAGLRRAEGSIRETRLDDPTGAVEAYAAAAHHDPHDLATARAIIRASALANTWPAAAEALAQICHAREVVDDEALGSLERAAERNGAWGPMLDALSHAVAAASLPPTIARELEAFCARGYRDALHDPDSAVVAATRAVAHDPSHRPTLLLLAEIQRLRPQDRHGNRPALAQTLLALDASSDRDLDALAEAAEVAVEADTDPQWRRDVVARLFGKAARLFARDETPTGHRAPEACALWAVEQLVGIDRDREHHGEAIATLLAAADLPLAARQRNELRIRTARLCAEIGDRSRAIDLLSLVLQDQGDEVELVREVADLCAQEGRVVELVRMRSKELQLTEEPERRLALRLEMSHLVGEVERIGGRVDSLKANLAERPGHRASIEALTEVLRGRGQVRDLVEILSDQARQLEHAKDSGRAAELWGHVATLAETELGEVPRAIAALERVAALAPTVEALDTIARLHVERGEPAAAADVLATRLRSTDTDKRVGVLLRLAKAQIAADRELQAMLTLRAAFDEAPKNGEARKLLLKLYREHERWEDLATCMSIASEHTSDSDTVIAYAKEAAEIFHDRLGTPERAIAVLERALPLAPDDRELRGRLVEGLRVAERLDDAHELARELIASFGRRRSPQRAAAHMQLARVARDRGDVQEALEQLEQAATMDAGSTRILRTLAEMARDADHLDRSERAYRALLLQVKRQPRREQDGPVEERIGPAEVLFQLSSLAKRRGDTVVAAELVESALEALAADDGEGPALQRALRERGEHELLRRVLMARLERAPSVRQQAELVGELAELQEHPLRELDAAFSSRLQAIRLDPGTPLHHERARELAARLGRMDDYVAFIEDQLDQARRNTDVYVRCELLLRLAEVTAAELGDATRAAALLKQAEALGVREVDVWRSAARIAAARGDADEQMHYLGRLSAIGEGETETRTDALYRVAEVQLASDESREQGIDTLTAALEADPRYERALRILLRAAETSTSSRLLALFERVARQVGDPDLLLRAIERKATLPESVPEELREGVELAWARGEGARAEALMMRAVELVDEDDADAQAKLGWARLGLAAARQSASDEPGAVQWMAEAVRHARDADAIIPAATALADAIVRRGENLPAAVELYELLRDRDAHRRSVWEPLAALYRRMGETDRLHRLVEETLDSIEDASERNGLRLQLAQTLLERPDREQEAITLLHAILADDPQHLAAQELMGAVLERTGREHDLAELLQRQWMAAQEQGDPTVIVASALRLAERQRRFDERQAATTLRSALEWSPGNTVVMRTLLGLLTRDEDYEERQLLLARLIEAEPPEAAAELALELAALCNRRGDADGELAALKTAYRKQPRHEELRTRLETAYTVRGDDRGLAEMLLEAEQDDPRQRVAALRQAATIYLERLGDGQAAIDALGQAYELAPDDHELGLEYARVLATSGDRERAHDLVTDLLAAPIEDAGTRLRLHLTRADLRQAQGDQDGSVADLEAAAVIDPEEVLPRLVAALTAIRDTAAATGDVDAERHATLRLADVFMGQGQREQTRAMLFEWVERERKDVDALRRLRDLEREDANWEQVKKLCARLVAIESGEGQVEAALQLSAACHAMGRPKDARPGLEHARRKQPDHPAIRRELIVVYEEIGAERELAGLLAQEAEVTEDPEARLQLLRRAAELHLRHHDPELAVPALREVLTHTPGDAWATLALVDSHLALGQVDEADGILDVAIEDARTRRTPELATLYHRKAQVAGARGDAQGQLGMLQQAFALDKNNGYIAADLADVAEALESWDLAIRVLRTITLLDTESPISRTQAFLRQARICSIRGDRQRAVLWARKAKHESPDDVEVDDFLRGLGEG